MPLPLYANAFTTTLAAAVTTATATTISVTSATGLPVFASPATGLTGATVTFTQRVSPIIVGSEIMYVTAVTGTTLTVERGKEGTTATTHAAGAGVAQIVTRDSLIFNSHPGAVHANLATAINQVYTPDLNYKYHFLTIHGNTAVQIGAPTGLTPELGHEVRLHVQVGTTLAAAAAQPTYNAVWTPNPTTATTVAATAAVPTQVSVSFAYKGLGTVASAVWRRIQ